MITAAQWKSLLWLKPTDFRHPDKLQWSIVRALDAFIFQVGSKPKVISDWRPFDSAAKTTQQHPKGYAIDTDWGFEDPVIIWEKMRSSRLFSGMGVYRNQLGVVTFHTDTRVERTVQDPALWGVFITYPYNPATGTVVRHDQFVAADAVIDVLKKKGTIVALMVGTLLFVILKKL